MHATLQAGGAGRRRPSPASRLLLVASLILLASPCSGNKFLETFTRACHHTFPNGAYFDLSSLARTPGRDDFAAEDTDGRTYIFNVCRDVQQIPQECRTLGKLMRSPGYVIVNNSDCSWLGDLGKAQWSLIDSNDPMMGLDLQYFHGEECAPGAFKQLRYRLWCDPTGQMGSPSDYLVEYNPELCLSTITFPSKAGCPVSGHVSQGWSFTIAFVVIATAYLVGGMAYNVHQSDGALTFGWDAIPHRRFWMELPELVKDGIVFSVNWASGHASSMGLSSSQRGGFQDLDSYEGGFNNNGPGQSGGDEQFEWN